jgi:hypothetical protein
VNLSKPPCRSVAVLTRRGFWLPLKLAWEVKVLTMDEY